MTEREQIAWAAGLFEGEGCITFERGDARACVRINMTDEEPLRRFASIIGFGKVYGPYAQGGNRSPYWAWYARQADAFAVIDLLTPWLSRRRLKRAEEVRRLAVTEKRTRLSGWERKRQKVTA